MKLEILGTAPDSVPADSLPLFLSAVAAGFPSPADDFMERKLNLHEYMVRNEHATFFLRAHGESMRDAGIGDGDLLVVDRSIEARQGRVVIAAVDGELTVKRLALKAGRVLLAPENPEFPSLDVTERDVHLWGVVTYVVHKV